MLGILAESSGVGDHQTFVIGTYDILSGTPIHYHLIEGPAAGIIWTNGEYIQFATLDVWSITIWEFEFISKHLPTEVSSMPTPGNFDPWGEFLFYPTPPQLAFTYEKTLLVWDGNQSKFLLDHEGSNKIAFSCDGHFLASATQVGEIHLWEECPAGYILHQKLVSGIKLGWHLFLSPNGQSVIMHGGNVFQLLCTTNSAATLHSTLTQLDLLTGLDISFWTFQKMDYWQWLHG